MRAALLPGVVVVALLSACSKSGDGKAAEDYCKKKYDALGALDLRCGAATAEYSKVLAERSEAFYCANVRKLAQDGRLVFDSAKGDQCLERVASASCAPGTFGGDASPCAQDLVGAVTLGGECYDGQECAPGWQCVFSGHCPGACLKLGQSGEGCGDAGCAFGLRCMEGVCVDLGGEGESCDSGNNAGCQFNLWCGYASNKCRPIGVLSSGECEGPPDCAWGYLCVGYDRLAGRTGSCVKGKALNEACGPGECLSWLCKGGVCVERPGLGEPCGALDGDYAFCKVGYCSSEASQGAETSGTCLDYTKTGEHCESHAECELFTYCGELARKCRTVCAP
ncbi:MAG: hypothetical protein QM765_30580 [Myxococcales bacterium]